MARAGVEMHRFAPEALASVELPADARASLATVGLPVELILPGWTGPTLFTCEREPALAPLVIWIPSHPRGADYRVIGSIRDPGGTSPDPYSLFCLHARTGEVVLADLRNRPPDPFVNSSVGKLVECLLRFHEAWASLVEDPPVRAAERYTAMIDAIDSRALTEDRNYWSSWLEELGVE